MTLNEYQTQALSFRLPSANPLYALLNLASEVGELHGHIAKGIRDNPNEDYVPNVRKELGDILWCLSAVSADFRFSLEEISTVNILEFLDLIEMDFSELVEILEEQCEEHYTRLHRACL